MKTFYSSTHERQGTLQLTAVPAHIMATGLVLGSGLPDENKGPQILGAVAATTILALIVVAMRLYVRVWMLRSASFDDYFIVASMVNPIFPEALIHIVLTL